MKPLPLSHCINPETLELVGDGNYPGSEPTAQEERSSQQRMVGDCDDVWDEDWWEYVGEAVQSGCGISLTPEQTEALWKAFRSHEAKSPTD